jgi:phosphoribosylamine--glycine ligase
VVTPAVHTRIMDEIMRPTVAALAQEGTRYVGFLYAGVMIDPAGTPRVLEFNCRFGDPETQPILARMRSDIVSLCEAGLDGGLAGVEVDWDPRAAVGVVLAAAGYPETIRRGDEIHGLDAAARLPGKVFHAGTALGENGQVVTSGGRVLCAVGLGTTVRSAQAQAYELVGAIGWTGMQFRKDIGYRAIAREYGHRS